MDRKPLALLFYDAGCPLCARLARRWRGWLARAGVVCAPLQGGLARRCAGPPAGNREEILLWEGHDAVTGGAEALVRCWARHPHGHAIAIAAWARLPGVPRILDLCYRFVAAHRPCRGDCRSRARAPAEDAGPGDPP